MLKRVLLPAAALLSMTFTAASAAPPPPPVEGTDYFVIDTPATPASAKVEVTEVFGYGCPHCNELQPFISAWAHKLPAYVHFSYLPAAFEPGEPHCWEEFSRAFFAAQAMGIQERSHDGVYKAVWEQHRFNGCASIPAIYADFGPDPKVFASTMQSFAVNARIAATHDREIHWGVEGTPTVIIDEKYRVPELVAGGHESMLRTVDWLIAREHAKH